MTVKRGGELVFKMDSTFSISTNPNFRFTFGRGADNSLDVAITDTDGTRFTAQSEPSGSVAATSVRLISGCGCGCLLE